MVTFEKIVLTTDFSENAKAAIPFAVELAHKFEGTIHLLHVYEDVSSYMAAAIANGIVIGGLSWVEDFQKEREAKIRTYAAELSRDNKVRVIPVSRMSNKPEVEIVRYAHENHADCIVIATHGRSGFSHMMYGSVAERVARLSHCPVLTIRPQAVGDKAKVGAEAHAEQGAVATTAAV